MARHMSFSKTTKQIYDKTKTETMRMGWNNLEPGDIVIAVEKAQGLKKGEKVIKITPIRIKYKIETIVMDVSPENCIKEGFPELTTSDFIGMFCKLNKCRPFDSVNRFGFEYLSWKDIEILGLGGNIDNCRKLGVKI